MNAVMYVPTASGGHARYAAELLTAMKALPDEKPQMSLVTSVDIAAEFSTDLYRVERILPSLCTSRPFRTRLHWAASRLAHYYRRDSLFVDWVKQHSQIDVIHFQEYCPLFASQHFRKLKSEGKRLFYTVHNIEPHRRVPAIGAAFNQLMRSAWSQCDGLFVHTEGLKSTLERFLGPTRPEVFVVHHGVWTEAGEYPPLVTEQQIGLRRLLCFGVLRRNKGIHILLEALHELPDFSLTVVGAPSDHSYVAELQSLARQFSDGRVTIDPRFVEAGEVARFFRQSSAVVLPYTEFSAQSGVLHDALAHEIPVVVTDVGALGESVREMAIGTIAQSRDVGSLRDAIRRLHESATYEAAATALRQARQDRSWAQAARATIGAYESRTQPSGVALV